MPKQYASIGGVWVPVGNVSEVEIGPSDPIVANPAAEFWYDTDATTPDALLQQWNTAWGVIATAASLGNVNITAPAANTALTASVTVTLLAGRRYRLTFRASAAVASSAFGSAYAICEGTTGVGDSDKWEYAPGNYAGVDVTTYWNGDGAAHTLLARCVSLNTAAGQTLQVQGKPLFIEDVGPISGAIPTANPTPAWINLPLINGWVMENASPQYRKVGDITYLRGTIQHATTSAGNPPWSPLPAGYGPPQTVRLQVGAHAGGVGGSIFCRTDVGTTGEFALQGYSASCPSPCLYLNGIAWSVSP